MSKVHQICGLLKTLPDVIYDLHSAETPSDEEWQRYITQIGRMARLSDRQVVKVIVFSDGYSPNAEQREQMRAQVGPGGSRTIVFTESMLVRGVVTAMSWFVGGLRAYGPKEWKAALRHMEIPESKHAQLFAELDQLGRSMASRTVLDKMLGAANYKTL